MGAKAMTDNGSILAEYLRISKDDGRFGESQSIENQRKLIADYVASHPDLKCKTAVEFVDDGFTGLNFSRPDATRMLEMAKRGEIDCIIVKDFSRFSRDYIEAGDYLEQIFPFLGVRFISVNDGYDSAIHGSLAGDVGNGFKNLYNSYYSKDLSKKVRTGLLAKKQSGSFTPSRCPYGYKKAARAGIGMEVDEDAAVIVRRIFALRAEGISTKEIARVLNIEGVNTPQTHKQSNGSDMKSGAVFSKPLWAAEKIRLILHDIRYTGAFAYNMYESVAIGTRETIKLPQEKWGLIPNAIPVIIPIDVYEKVQPPKRSREYTNSGGKGKRPLARKLICGGCGYALTVDAKTNTCSCDRREFTDNDECVGSAIEMEVIENTLTAVIQKMVNVCGTQRSAGNKQSAKRSSGIAKSIREVQRRIKAASEKKTSLYDQYCDEKLTRSDYIRLRDEEDKAIAKLNMELLDLEQSQAETDFDPHSEMRGRIDGLYWNGTLTREITEALLERVVAYNNGRFEIQWTFSDPFMSEQQGGSINMTSATINQSSKINRTALYCRVATANQYDTNSIDNQLSRLRSFAETQGFSDFTEYVDNGFSGLTLERPELTRLTADIEACKIGTVVALSTDRIARGFILAREWLKRINAYNVELITMDGSSETLMLNFHGYCGNVQA